MGSTARVSGESIRFLREKAGGSQEWLAKAVGVDVGTLSRWERGKIRSVKRPLIAKLCEHLRASEGEIFGEVLLPEIRPVHQPAPRGQMNLSIGNACRNAMQLAARRYGVTRQQIVELAPLLFFIAAEKSLLERKDRLEKARAEARAVFEEELCRAASRFGDRRVTLLEKVDGILIDADTATELLDDEEKLIERHDIFNSIESARAPDSYSFLFDLEACNPIADALNDALKEVRPGSQPVKWEWESLQGRFGSPNYRICAETAEDIVGGDKDAVERILTGAVALHEMPREIRRASPPERGKWVMSGSRSVSAEEGDDQPIVNVLDIQF